MLRSDWLFFIAIGLILAFGLVFAGLANQQREAASGDDCAAEIHTEANKIEAENAPPHPHQTNPDTPNKDHEARDLRAQEGMALWAERLFWATVVGIILLALTFWETFRTANAAHDAVKVTRESAERQLRAYVSAIEGHIDTQAEPPTISGIVHAINSGQTPAYNVRWRAIAGLTDKPSDMVEYPSPDGEDWFQFGIIGPSRDATFRKRGPNATEAILANFRNRTLTYYIHWQIEYTTLDRRYRLGQKASGHFVAAKNQWVMRPHHGGSYEQEIPD